MVYIKQFNSKNKRIRQVLRKGKGEITCKGRVYKSLRLVIYQCGLCYHVTVVKIGESFRILYDLNKAIRHLDFHPSMNKYNKSNRYLNIQDRETYTQYKNRMLRIIFRVRALYERNFSPSGELIDTQKENRYTKIEDRILDQLRIIAKYYT